MELGLGARHLPGLISFKASEAHELDAIISLVIPGPRKVGHGGSYSPVVENSASTPRLSSPSAGRRSGVERVEKMERAECALPGTWHTQCGDRRPTRDKQGTDQVGRGKDGVTVIPTRCPERVYTEQGWVQRVVLRSFLSLFKYL